MKERYRPNFEGGLMSGPIILLYLTTATVLGLIICTDSYTAPSPDRKTSILEPVPYNPDKAHIETIAGITIDHRDGGFLISRPVLGIQVIDPASR